MKALRKVIAAVAFGILGISAANAECLDRYDNVVSCNSPQAVYRIAPPPRPSACCVEPRSRPGLCDRDRRPVCGRGADPDGYTDRRDDDDYDGDRYHRYRHRY